MELVAPLIRKKVSASITPWENLKVGQVQDIVDHVFGEGKYEVVEDGPWYGLVRQSTRGQPLLLMRYEVRSTSLHLAQYFCTKGA